MTKHLSTPTNAVLVAINMSKHRQEVLIEQPRVAGAFSDRQPLFLVNPVELFPVHRDALPLQKQVQAAV